MKKTALALILIVFLFGVVTVSEARPSRDIEKRVFIHRAKGGIPGKPEGGNGGGEKLWYKYSGIHWADTQLPINYVVDPEYSGLDYSLAFSVIVASFETWDDETDTELFGTGQQGDVVAGVRDWKNGISFGDYPSDGVIAVTFIWYYSDTGEIIEVDTLFDTDYVWTISEKGVDETMDLQNIATHEFGHWLVLDDLYMKPAKQQTMYGYSTYGEIKKRTVESGDIAGLEEIYGP